MSIFDENFHFWSKVELFKDYLEHPGHPKMKETKWLSNFPLETSSAEEFIINLNNKIFSKIN